MSNYQLRPYQEDALEKLFEWFRNNKTGNPVVSSCVGSGKSILIAELCRRVMTQYPNQRIIMLVSSRELLVQNYEKLRAVYPDGDYGLYAASMGKKKPHAKIVFATIGSVYNKYMQVGAFDLVVSDECHLINTKEVGIYRSFISDLSKLNPRVRVIGFTGTNFRGSGILITEGKDALFTDTAVDISIRDMLDGGYLAPLVLCETKTKTDITGVHVSKLTGDYNVGELAKAIDKDDITQSVADEIMIMAADRKSWLIFGVSVEHCDHLHKALEARGAIGAVVTGKTPKAQRDRIISQYKAGKIRYIVNALVLTIGFDAPQTDFIALVRNTKSPCLFVQIAGRGMRIAQGKTDCGWADFTSSTECLGSIDQIKGRKEAPKGGEAPKKKCPQCETILHASAAICFCGFEFEISEADRLKDIRRKASEAAILSQPEMPILFEVGGWRCSAHSKAGSPDSLKVTYTSSVGGNLNLDSHSEWVCIAHSGYAVIKAQKWWKALGGTYPAPVTIDEAISRFTELQKPDYLKLKQNGKYTEITNHVYNNAPAPVVVLPNPAREASANPQSRNLLADIAANANRNALPNL